MTQQINLSFVANQSWFMVLDLSQWALLYDFTQGTLRMQFRTQFGDPNIVYAFSSTPKLDNTAGTIVYDPATNFMYAIAPYEDMLQLAGTYAPFFGVHDIQYTSPLIVLPGVPLIQDLAAGTVAITNGVTFS